MVEYLIWVSTAKENLQSRFCSENDVVVFVTEPFLEAIPQATIMLVLGRAEGCGKSLVLRSREFFWHYFHVCSR